MWSRTLMAGAGAALLATAGEPAEANREALLKQYRLAEGENVKHIPPPHRLATPHRKHGPPVPDHMDIAPMPDAAYYYWDAEKGLRSRGRSFGDVRVRSFLGSTLGLKRFEIEGDRAVLETEMRGDFLMRTGVPANKLLPELEAILESHFKTKAHLEFRDVKRKVYVAKGTFHHRPIRKPPDHEWISLYVLKATEKPASSGCGGGSGNLQALLGAVGWYVNDFVVDETTGTPPEEVFWEYSERAPSAAGAAWALLHVTEQTGLTFTEEERSMRVLVVRSTE